MQISKWKCLVVGNSEYAILLNTQHSISSSSNNSNANFCLSARARAKTFICVVSEGTYVLFIEKYNAQTYITRFVISNCRCCMAEVVAWRGRTRFLLLLCHLNYVHDTVWIECCRAQSERHALRSSSFSRRIGENGERWHGVFRWRIFWLNVDFNTFILFSAAWNSFGAILENICALNTVCVCSWVFVQMLRKEAKARNIAFRKRPIRFESFPAALRTTYTVDSAHTDTYKWQVATGNNKSAVLAKYLIVFCVLHRFSYCIYLHWKRNMLSFCFSPHRNSHSLHSHRSHLSRSREY